MSVELVPLECGWLQQAGSILEAGASECIIETPVPAWLIHHPKETVLFDAGLHPDLRHSPDTMGRLAPLFTAILEEGLQTIEIALIAGPGHYLRHSWLVIRWRLGNNPIEIFIEPLVQQAVIVE